MDSPAIDVTALRKSFGSHRALDDVSFQVGRGEMVALLGASGSGKSTLLRHLSGLHRADAGGVSRVTVLGKTVQEAGRLGRKIRATRSRVAVVFQQFNLVDRLPVMTNVMAGALHRLPFWRGFFRVYPAAELQRAREALQRMGIADRAWQRASTLSGGQQQRAAISRALVQGAEVILADEPIASLDPASCKRVLEALAAVNRDFGVTVLISLHQVEYAFAFCPRTIALRHGVVVYDGPTSALSKERLQDLYGTEVDALYDVAEPPSERPAPPRTSAIDRIVALQPELLTA